MRTPEVVAFVSIEDEDPDFVVSFALEPQGSRSITLLRTPHHEELLNLAEEDRGVAVMSDGQHPTRELLQSISFDPDEIVIQSQVRTQRLSASKLSAEDRADAVNMLKRMNFDGRFVINAA